MLLKIHNRRMLEVAETEELFKNSIHPFTQVLLLAVPIPDPILAKKLN